MISKSTILPKKIGLTRGQLLRYCGYRIRRSQNCVKQYNGNKMDQDNVEEFNEEDTIIQSYTHIIMIGMGTKCQILDQI